MKPNHSGGVQRDVNSTNKSNTGMKKSLTLLASVEKDIW